jgi:hypothetical protein
LNLPKDGEWPKLFLVALLAQFVVLRQVTPICLLNLIERGGKMTRVLLRMSLFVLFLISLNTYAFASGTCHITNAKDGAGHTIHISYNAVANSLTDCKTAVLDSMTKFDPSRAYSFVSPITTLSSFTNGSVVTTILCTAKPRTIGTCR